MGASERSGDEEQAAVRTLLDERVAEAARWQDWDSEYGSLSRALTFFAPLIEAEARNADFGKIWTAQKGWES